eukprot:scaffold7106_cov121-Cylindrotheca_fusiformis.AAC.1
MKALTNETSRFVYFLYSGRLLAVSTVHALLYFRSKAFNGQRSYAARLQRIPLCISHSFEELQTNVGMRPRLNKDTPRLNPACKMMDCYLLLSRCGKLRRLVPATHPYVITKLLKLRTNVGMRPPVNTDTC